MLKWLKTNYLLIINLFAMDYLAIIKNQINIRFCDRFANVLFHNCLTLLSIENDSRQNTLESLLTFGKALRDQERATDP